MSEALNITLGTTICPHGNQWCDGPGGQRPCSQCCQAMRGEIQRLNTWAGLVSLLDTHYPADLVDGSSGDPGPTIIVLARVIDQLQTDLADATDTIQGLADQNIELRRPVSKAGKTSTTIAELINLGSGCAASGDSLAVKICQDGVMEIERMQAIANAAGNLDGVISHAHVVLVDKDKFDAIHIAWSDWKAADTEDDNDVD